MPRHVCLLGAILFLYSIAAGSNAATPVVMAQLPPDFGALCLKFVDGKVWIGTSAGLFGETGDRLRRVGSFDQAIWEIVSLHGHVWVKTTRGVARVDGDNVKPVGTPPIDVQRIEEVGDNVWLFSDRDVWEVASNLECRRVIEKQIFPSAIKSTSRESWFTGLGSGAFKVTHGNPWSTVVSVPDIYEVETEGETCWLGGKQGLSEVADGKLIHRYLEGQRITMLKFWNEALWAATESGIYRLWRGTTERKMTLVRPTHLYAEPNGNNLWLTGHTIYRIDSSNTIHTGPEDFTGVPFFESEKLAYFNDFPTGIFVFKNGRFSKMPENEDFSPNFQETDKSFWILGTEALWRLENGKAKKACPNTEWGVAVSKGPQGTWLIGEDYMKKIEDGKCRRFPDREIRVRDMIQTPSDVWVTTIEGDLLRIKAGNVETLTLPIPQALIKNQPPIKALRFIGEVREVTLKEDKPDSITFNLTMDLEFKNDSDMPVYIVDGSPVIKEWKYWVSCKTLAYSFDASMNKKYLIEDPGIWPGNYRGPDYLAFRDCLDNPKPSGKCLRHLSPGESYKFTEKGFLSVDKKKSSSVARYGKSWEEIDASRPLLLQVDVESWPINLDYGYRLNIATPRYDAFRLMLQRRWQRHGLLPPDKMRSEPMPIDLSRWATAKQ